MEDRLGEERLMNCGLKAKIIRYRDHQDIDVEFEDGFISYNKTYRNFTLGRIGNKNIKKDMLKILSCVRCRFLQHIHQTQRKLDYIDSTIYKLKKQ